MKRSACVILKHRVGKLAQLSGRPHRLARNEQRRRDLEVSARSLRDRGRMPSSARERRAPAPVSTENRLPESFAARAKSRIPSVSPSSQCGFGVKSNRARLAPAAHLDVGALRRRRRERSRRADSAGCRAARATAKPSSVRRESARALRSLRRRCAKLGDLRSELARGGRFIARLADRGESRFFSAFARSTAREGGAVLLVVAQKLVDQRGIEPATNESAVARGRDRAESERCRAWRSAPLCSP